MTSFNDREREELLDQWLSKTIDELLYDDSIDTRTANIAKREGMTSLEELLRCFLKNGKSFRHFEFAGKKVDAMLSDLLREGMRKFGLVESDLDGVIDQFLPPPLPIELEISFHNRELSAPGFSATKNIWKASGQTIDGLLAYLVDPLRWQGLTQTEPKVIKELEAYWPKILPRLIADAKGIADWKKILLASVHTHFGAALPAALHFLMEKDGCPFDFARVLLHSTHPHSDRDNALFDAFYHVEDKGTGVSMEEIGVHFGLTRERIRQILNRMQDTMERFLVNFLQVFGSYCLRPIPSECWDRDCFVVQKSDLLLLVPSEFHEYYFDQRILFLRLTLDERFVWLETRREGLGIFVRKRLLHYMHWDEIEAYISSQHHAKAAQQFTTTIAELASQFFNAEASGEYFSRMQLILPSLMEKCLGMKLGLDGRYRFRNQTELGHIRILMIQQLKEAMEPIHFQDLYEKIGGHENFPELDPKQTSSLIREMPEAKSLGLSGYYYHVDNASKVPRFGPWSTFEELIIGYLQDSGAPAHISKLVQHVQGYRNSDRLSLRATLETLVDTPLNYQGGGYWGLKGQAYSALRFRKIPMHTYRIVDRILNRRPQHVIEQAELCKLLQEELGLTAVQVLDWLESRVAEGKLRLEDGMVGRL